jgi:integrase
MTKNDDGRIVYMTPDLCRLVTTQVARVRDLERETGRIIPWLFPHLKKPFRGERRRDYVYAWKSACKKTGVSGRLRHDLRRTAVRNLVNAGVPERVAMTITGHKTGTKRLGVRRDGRLALTQLLGFIHTDGKTRRDDLWPTDPVRAS